MSTRMPQQIAPRAPIGSLLKQPRAARAKRTGRAVRTQDADYLAAIRQLPCCKCGMEPCGEAAHVRMNSAAHGKRGSMAAKPDDKWCAPLCGGCHRLDADSQHHIGEGQFWCTLDLNPLLICEALYAASPDVVKMRAIVLSFIAGRE